MFDIRQWRIAGVKLTEAAQAYLDACTSLNEAMSEMPNDPHTRDTIILHARSAFPAVQVIQNILASSCDVMDKISSMPTNHVSANTLLPEILSRVFVLAASDSWCSFDDTTLGVDTLSAVTSVCTRWRQIAIGTRSLWSHIDLRKSNQRKGRGRYVSNIAQLWLERTQGTPIELHIEEYRSISNEGISEIISILRAHSSPISSLIVESSCHPKLGAALLAHCALQLSPGSLINLYMNHMGVAPDIETLKLPSGEMGNMRHLRLDTFPSTNLPHSCSAQ
ncbi:hypothetical protein BDV93DRAFT_563618 [Ceratobasidium sp. AG-I]|nr:hypothetical protein BDV93DRAFT_563618 [Ceratobasidium sp. AG-I]